METPQPEHIPVGLEPEQIGATPEQPQLPPAEDQPEEEIKEISAEETTESQPTMLENPEKNESPNEEISTSPNQE